jgi:hypothetical protein
MGTAAYHPTNQTQRISVHVELLPGPQQTSVIERVRRSIIEELLQMGAEITAVHVHITGQMAAR